MGTASAPQPPPVTAPTLMTAQALQKTASSFTNFTPAVDHQPPHPADVPETLASLEKARKMLGWEPLVCFPSGNEDGAKKV